MASAPPSSIKSPLELMVPQILPLALQWPPSLWPEAGCTLAARIASEIKT